MDVRTLQRRAIQSSMYTLHLSLFKHLFHLFYWWGGVEGGGGRWSYKHFPFGGKRKKRKKMEIKGYKKIYRVQAYSSSFFLLPFLSSHPSSQHTLFLSIFILLYFFYINTSFRWCASWSFLLRKCNGPNVRLFNIPNRTSGYLYCRKWFAHHGVLRAAWCQCWTSSC